MSIPAITVHELRRRLESGERVYLLDVRTDEEFSAEHLRLTSDVISHESVPYEISRLPREKDAEMYMFCRSGRRSGLVTEYLRQRGYTNVFNVEGGILAWKEAGYETVGDGQQSRL